MSERHTRNLIEAALLAAGRPLPLAELSQLFDGTDRPDIEALRVALAELGAEYEDRGVELRETASGFRIQVRAQFAAEVSRMWPERPQRYSRALLETLALIAYRQPLTRAEIESVRGVTVNPNILKTLMERNWIRVYGHRDVPGRPELLGTTREFLDYFGLRTLEQLPPLAELRALSDLNLQLALPGTADVSLSADFEPEAFADEAPLVPGEAVSADDDVTEGDEHDAAGHPAAERHGLVAAPRDFED